MQICYKRGLSQGIEAFMKLNIVANTEIVRQKHENIIMINLIQISF